jgi:CRISPR type IV-associated protein Csf3
VIPIRITATLDGGIQLSQGPVAIDALLAWVVCKLEDRPPITAGDVPDVAIPVAKENLGRFYMASFAMSEWELYERRFVQRKFPVGPAQRLAVEKFKRINVSAGPQKSYRIPGQIAHAVDDTLTWYAVADDEAVRDLLRFVTHLGKRRAAGRGKVRCWTVDPCEPWGAGFPVERDGKPLRNLPVDWPGLVSPLHAYATMSYPYWDHTREETCAVPESI